MKEKLFSNTFSFWDKLSRSEKDTLINKSIEVNYGKGQIIHRSDMKYTGAIIVVSGTMRVYIISEEGREVTLFRIYAGDSCVLSAACLLETIEFEIMVEPVAAIHIVIIPTEALRPIMKSNPYVELYIYKKATERFSDVMWTIQQILFMSADRRVAIFLWDEMIRQNNATLKMTHDEIAKNIGSAREVVSKVLKYFAEDDAIRISRGKIQIIDRQRLQKYL